MIGDNLTGNCEWDNYDHLFEKNCCKRAPIELEAPHSNDSEVTGLMGIGTNLPTQVQ